MVTKHLEKWVRIPSKGKEPHSGLTRAFIYTLIKHNRIKTACIRDKGKLTGVRLIWLPSLFEYIEKHVDAGDQSRNS